MTDPTDAPFGPIARYVDRLARAGTLGVRRVLIGNERDKGGLLGWEAPSPRLEGWAQQAGINVDSLSRVAEYSTRWAKADPAKLRAEANLRAGELKRRELAPLMRKLDPLRPEDAGIQWFCKEAAKALNGPYSEEIDEDVSDAAIKVLDAGTIQPGPKGFTSALRDFYRGMTVEQMLRADGQDILDDV